LNAERSDVDTKKKRGRRALMAVLRKKDPEKKKPGEGEEKTNLGGDPPRQKSRRADETKRLVRGVDREGDQPREKRA